MWLFRCCSLILGLNTKHMSGIHVWFACGGPVIKALSLFGQLLFMCSDCRMSLYFSTVFDGIRHIE